MKSTLLTALLLAVAHVEATNSSFFAIGENSQFASLPTDISPFSKYWNRCVRMTENGRLLYSAATMENDIEYCNGRFSKFRLFDNGILTFQGMLVGRTKLPTNETLLVVANGMVPLTSRSDRFHLVDGRLQLKTKAKECVSAYGGILQIIPCENPSGLPIITDYTDTFSVRVGQNSKPRCYGVQFIGAYQFLMPGVYLGMSDIDYCNSRNSKFQLTSTGVLTFQGHAVRRAQPVNIMSSPFESMALGEETGTDRYEIVQGQLRLKSTNQCLIVDPEYLVLRFVNCKSAVSGPSIYRGSSSRFSLQNPRNSRCVDYSPASRRFDIRTNNTCFEEGSKFWLDQYGSLTFQGVPIGQKLVQGENVAVISSNTDATIYRIENRTQLLAGQQCLDLSKGFLRFVRCTGPSTVSVLFNF